jgi:N-methylhydantoinase B/oxoprolinase/acetone carboxylase alpha subunit
MFNIVYNIEHSSQSISIFCKTTFNITRNKIQHFNNMGFNMFSSSSSLARGSGGHGQWPRVDGATVRASLWPAHPVVLMTGARVHAPKAVASGAGARRDGDDTTHGKR